MSESRFDDIFSAASDFAPPELTSPQSIEARASSGDDRSKPSSRRKVPTSKTNDFWSDLDNKDDRVRLNVDISTALNDRLSAKARQLGQSKSVLVRRLIEWALE